MAQRAFRTASLATGLIAVAVAVGARAQQGAPPARPGVPAAGAPARGVSFQRDVLPLFQKRCQSCHIADAKGGLKLDSYESLMAGGAKTPTLVIPGQPERSRLIRLVEGLEAPRMPPVGAPLTQQERAVLRAWVAEGARNDSAPAAAAANRARAGLQLLAPKEGSTVREKVRILIPASAVPPEGFAAIYIDTRFKAALAPPSPEEIAEKKLRPDSPIVYVWDTKAPLLEGDTALTATSEERYVADGPHIIEVRTFQNGGRVAETARVTVNVQNSISAASNQSVRLWYGGQVGQQYFLEHTVDLKANAAQAAVNPRTGRAPAQAAGPDSITHQETAQYLIGLEDLMPGTGMTFWRERRESPLTVILNGVKQIVRFDTSSRYYAMDRRGVARVSRVMERENREPVINPITLPGRVHRLNQVFTTNLRINLGAYIPATLHVDRLAANIQGIEWQHGEPCVKIRVDYFAGKDKLSIHSANIRDADFDVAKGTSYIWFSQKTQRVVRATHELDGTLVVDVAQLGGAGAAPMPGAGGPGGELDPGLLAPGGAAGGYPGGAMGGYPGGAMGGYPGGAMAGRAPYGGMGGYAGGGMSGYPGGAMGGYPGGAMAGPFGAPFGGMGAFPGSSGNTGVGAPTTKRYHVTLKVTTNLTEPRQARR